MNKFTKEESKSVNLLVEQLVASELSGPNSLDEIAEIVNMYVDKIVDTLIQQLIKKEMTFPRNAREIAETCHVQRQSVYHRKKVMQKRLGIPDKEADRKKARLAQARASDLLKDLI